MRCCTMEKIKLLKIQKKVKRILSNLGIRGILLSQTENPEFIEGKTDFSPSVLF